MANDMKTTRFLRSVPALMGLAVLPLTAAPFNSGSDGSLGDLVVSSPTVIPLPPDGVLHYKRFEVTADGSVSFQKNALNTPVTLLAQGEVVITGDVFLDATPATGLDPGRGGPGGFDGGRPAQAGFPPGWGKGPGGGAPGDGSTAGPGGFATPGTIGGFPDHLGLTYGDPLLLPLIGGSGGGGRTDQFVSGGGGGGAILIASNVRIALPGPNRGIFARALDNFGYNDGSGGGIRLVAPVIEGIGIVTASGGPQGGAGRVRLDSPDLSKANFNMVRSVFSAGALMLTKLPIQPRLNLLKIGDSDIAPDALEPVSLIFPSGVPAERVIRVQARDFNAVVPIRLALIPDHGERVVVDAQIDNRAAGTATVDVPVTFPLNVSVSVSVWTR